MLSEKGFYRPSYDYLLKKQIERAKELFGDDIEVTETTVLGKFIRLSVYDISKLYEEMEQIYYARFPNTASGNSLDRLMPFAGISRNLETRAIHKLKLYGEPDSIIEAGFLFSTINDIIFYLINEQTLDSEGKAEVLVECGETGIIGNVKIGSIVNIVNPCAYLDRIEHIGINKLGNAMETDTELRKRFSETIAGSGTGTIDSIYCEIMRTQNVKGCMIIENDTNTEDLDGRPPNSFECYVLGGEDIDIAKAIYLKKPIGIKCVGDITINIMDKGGFEHEIKFSRTNEKDIYIKIHVKVNKLFEKNGTDDIKNNLINCFSSLSNGDNIILTSLYSNIHSVVGVIETSLLELSEDNINFKSANINCNSNEIAVLKKDNINIEVSAYVDN